MACYFKFFSTPTTVFVGVFVLLCFFLVIYYLVGACKGLMRGFKTKKPALLPLKMRVLKNPFALIDN
ncbi:hypothetical protein COF84_21125 [Bacillus wiedmannii]|nr:hypothetical protein COF84_21125 [Bacillus wiedmannii]